MATGRTRFCSPLLVNALLAAGCQSYHKIPNRNKFWLPHNLGYQFTAEAKRLWELERPGKSRLTTIQAAIVLNIVVNLNGLDRIGHAYLVQALAMAHDLKLFDVPQPLESDKMRKSRTITAWGLFNWQVMCSYYFFRTPFVEHPPKSPLPDPIACSAWYGEIWLRYPGAQMLTPTCLGCTFRARAALRSIMNDIARQLFGEPGNQGNSSLEQVLGFKSRLDAWLNNLPDPLTPTKIVFPAQLELQYVILFPALTSVL